MSRRIEFGNYKAETFRGEKIKGNRKGILRPELELDLNLKESFKCLGKLQFRMNSESARDE